MRMRAVFAALGLLALSACGSQVLSTAQMERLERDGVDLVLVYLVELPGYTLAEQSLGVIGEDGFGASYTGAGGKVAHLRVERAASADEVCAGPLLDAPPDAPVTCVRDDTGWYRTSNGRHEYVAFSGDHRLSLNAPLDDPDRDVLGRALAEAEDRFGSKARFGTPPPVRLNDPTPTTPAPRGDLPTIGDGAPVHPSGPGG
ncbi:hypothetical protein ABGB12_15375 [Actinocorallia sp. B10E7]|uniref:hypothetical protein n=1 Tax=Actinocorallia sp. B10E7 TaxID=3153558 RepID=UPI00325E5E77